MRIALELSGIDETAEFITDAKRDEQRFDFFMVTAILLETKIFALIYHKFSGHSRIIMRTDANSANTFVLVAL